MECFKADWGYAGSKVKARWGNLGKNISHCLYVQKTCKHIWFNTVLICLFSYKWYHRCYRSIITWAIWATTKHLSLFRPRVSQRVRSSYTNASTWSPCYWKSIVCQEWYRSCTLTNVGNVRTTWSRDFCGSSVTLCDGGKWKIEGGTSCNQLFNDPRLVHTCIPHFVLIPAVLSILSTRNCRAHSKMKQVLILNQKLVVYFMIFMNPWSNGPRGVALNPS